MSKSIEVLKKKLVEVLGVTPRNADAFIQNLTVEYIVRLDSIEPEAKQEALRPVVTADDIVDEPTTLTPVKTAAEAFNDLGKAAAPMADMVIDEAASLGTDWPSEEGVNAEAATHDPDLSHDAEHNDFIGQTKPQEDVAAQ